MITEQAFWVAKCDKCGEHYDGPDGESTVVFPSESIARTTLLEVGWKYRKRGKEIICEPCAEGIAFEAEMRANR